MKFKKGYISVVKKHRTLDTSVKSPSIMKMFTVTLFLEANIANIEIHKMSESYVVKCKIIFVTIHGKRDHLTEDNNFEQWANIARCCGQLSEHFSKHND